LERVFRYWKTDTENVQARIVQLAMMFSAQNGDIAEAASLGEQVVKIAPEFVEKERVSKHVNQLKQGKNPYRP
jgi:hypothetical protein